MEIYRKNIEMELVYEKDLLKKLEIDEHVRNKNFVKKRIEERIKKIEVEVEIPEEIQQEEEVVEVKDIEKSGNRIIHR
jgi:hypothetical protein